MRFTFFAAALILVATAGFPADASGFKDEVLPVLKAQCLECHKPGGMGHAKSGFDVTSYETLMKGTKNGPVVVPGDPFASVLMMVLDKRVHKSIRMPYKRPSLNKRERTVIRRWIARGAKNN